MKVVDFVGEVFEEFFGWIGGRLVLVVGEFDFGSGGGFVVGCV